MDFRERFFVSPDADLDLGRIDPGDVCGFDDKKAIEAMLSDNRKRLLQLQEKLYAENRQSLLIVLQAMDAGGKDGTINHVFAALNPQGCRVQSFKVPTDLEKAHDFLWRVHCVAPRSGEIVIFNRSHYEDVLIARVHGLVPESVWRERYGMINDFERLLASNRTKVVKFFLHISKEEQLKRFKDRFEDAAKNWKITESDYSERDHWNEYQSAFAEALRRCSTQAAPWYVIPADSKHFRNLAVSSIIAATLEDMKIELPKPSADLDVIKKLIKNEDGK